jgi:NAD+ synthase
MDIRTSGEKMRNQEIINLIVSWLIEKLDDSGCKGFVVGVSGGIDSALVSTLCCMTGRPTLVIGMPINQEKGQVSRSNEQMDFLTDKFDNCKQKTIDLTDTYNTFVSSVGFITGLSKANLQSRLRMCSLYTQANNMNYLVSGTGNKVEDFGVGFFTKFGDGGVDISPIADLLKTEVYKLASFLGVPRSIQEAKPTDGLWDDNRGDEDQIGATYPELEWAMSFEGDELTLTPRELKVLSIYRARNSATKHKLSGPPICEIPESLKNS